MPIDKMINDIWFMHMYHLSGPNRAYHGVNDRLKSKVLICGAQIRKI